MKKFIDDIKITISRETNLSENHIEVIYKEGVSEFLNIFFIFKYRYINENWINRLKDNALYTSWFYTFHAILIKNTF